MRAKRSRKKVPPLLWRLLKRYLANSSIHGVRYLVEDGRHWTERLFWLISCGLSWWGCAILILGVFDEFNNRRTSVTVGTNYIDWPAELPSIHLCGQPGPGSAAYIYKVWPKARTITKLESDRNLGYDSSLPKPFEREYFEGYYRAIYLLSPTEIPSVASEHEQKFGNKWKTSEVVEIDVWQQPIYNAEGVRGVPVEKRNCRFINENENSRVYRYYGYDACVAEADLIRMYDLCGCINHLNPQGPSIPVCNQTQLKCVWNSRDLIFNDNYTGCVPDCETTVYNFFENYSEETTDEGAHFNVHLLPGPMIRYVRYVVHSELDVVVAVGSALGLFVGASVLTLVEIPYWFLVRGINDNDEDDNSSVDDDHKNN